MSHANNAATALRDAANAATRPVAAAVRSAQEARAEVALAGDIVQCMGSVASLIIACEAMQDAGKLAEAELRAKLASVMTEVGAATIHTEFHTVSLREAPRTVRIIDPDQIPPELMRQPPPAPDKIEIGKLLRDGKSVPGAALNNQREQVVAIRNRERASA